jgi:alanyl-tRNA synthetase
LETEVLESGAEDGVEWVVLADTVLYPEGGGQPADAGTVGGVAVSDVQKTSGVIRHLLAGAAPSGRVTVELDWHRRFDHMQQHTAQHLVTAVAEDRFGWPTTSFHLGETMSDVELDVANLGPLDLDALEEAVAEEVRRARPVTARRVTREDYGALTVRSRGLPEGHTGSIRLVEIHGVDLNTCGGTHCASTAELEAVKLLGCEPLRGGTRVHFVAGHRLRRLLGAHHRRSAELRALLGASDEELVRGLETRLEQLKDAHRAMRDLQGELASAAAAALAVAPDPILQAHWPDRDLSFLQRVARELDALAPERVVFLTTGEDEEGYFLLSAGPQAHADVPSLGRAVAKRLSGRGGGSGRMFQGRAGGLSQREEALEAVREAISD